ncbi:hypothetical protein MFU01_00070 [Myxococcus fulvus]|uniref:Uncharacterized protein n=1 Tax=Myxococcus fulvus TaxID=33 RepID=A0A511SSQ1_MYXFU|nr:hypothetical protein MFU01_00070 [Myxococcus fulvus]
MKERERQQGTGGWAPSRSNPTRDFEATLTREPEAALNWVQRLLRVLRFIGFVRIVNVIMVAAPFRETLRRVIFVPDTARLF